MTLSSAGRAYDSDRGDWAKILPGSGTDNMVVSLDGPATDTTCFKMPSYLVARDRKGSDSTHLVGYSTCQPSSRYQLRKTVINDTPSQ